MSGSSRGQIHEEQRGGEHHIATDHRPMVQGGLLTVHPGSIHGGGGAPGGDTSLRQGVGKRSSGAPNLGSATTAEQREIAKKGSVPEGFSSQGINRRKGAARGGPGAPGAPLARPGVDLSKGIVVWPLLSFFWWPQWLFLFLSFVLFGIL